MSQEQTKTIAFSVTLIPPKEILEMMSVPEDVEAELSLDDRVLTVRPRNEMIHAQMAYQNSHIDLNKRREAVRTIDALREKLFEKYGEMPDSVELVREIRDGDE
jgi:hypothetical protein